MEEPEPLAPPPPVSEMHFIICANKFDLGYCFVHIYGK